MSESQFVTANGIRIHYKEYGSGDPLILLHGGTANLDSWEGQIPTLSQHFKVIALDSRGHGLSNNPSGEFSYRLLADDTAAFIQALNLSKPLILGYSDGGQIALELGIHYPDAPRALILGGTTHRFTDEYFSTIKSWGFEKSGYVNTKRMAEVQPGWIDYLQASHPRPDDPDYWKTLVNQISVMWWEPLNYTKEDFQKMTAPVLILLGDRDDAVKIELNVEMYRLIPHAELMVVPNADHGGATAQLASDMVIDFLKRAQAVQ
jgi:pimeloyl-ACP methyl ester carboxylesterase